VIDTPLQLVISIQSNARLPNTAQKKMHKDYKGGTVTIFIFIIM